LFSVDILKLVDCVVRKVGHLVDGLGVEGAATVGEQLGEEGGPRQPSDQLKIILHFNYNDFLYSIDVLKNYERCLKIGIPTIVTTRST